MIDFKLILHNEPTPARLEVCVFMHRYGLRMSRSVSALEKLGKAGKVFGFGAWLFDSCTPAVAPGSVNAVRASPDTFSTLHTGNPAGEDNDDEYDDECHESRADKKEMGSRKME